MIIRVANTVFTVKPSRLGAQLHHDRAEVTAAAEEKSAPKRRAN
jgi:hypothetical protein